MLCVGWIDSKTVLALSTVHTVHQNTDAVVKNRRRPAGQTPGAKKARRAFGTERRKELPIPRLINDYNHCMGGVDVADQLRATYASQRKALRNWFPLFHWVLDHACINAWKVSRRTRSSQIFNSAANSYTRSAAKTIMASSIGRLRRIKAFTSHYFTSC